MNKLFLISTFLLISNTSYSSSGTYNLRNSFECVGNAESWSDYYLGPVEFNESNGNCMADTTKTCHDTQEFATFFPNELKKKTTPSICDIMGIERCEILKVYLEKDASNLNDTISFERISQSMGSSETIEKKTFAISPNTTLEGHFYLPGEDCMNEIKIQLIPVN